MSTRSDFPESQKISGYGMDVTVHMPCPFCAAPEWMIFKILEQEEVSSKEHVCKECTRGARMIYTHDGPSTSFEVVQTQGPDSPDFVPKCDASRYHAAPTYPCPTSFISIDAAVESNLILLGKIRVTFEVDSEGSRVEAVFECLSCSDLLAWHPGRHWWFCPSCGYELTAPEAKRVIDFARERLRDLSRTVGRGGGEWGLVRWLRRLLRLKGA